MEQQTTNFATALAALFRDPENTAIYRESTGPDFNFSIRVSNGKKSLVRHQRNPDGGDTYGIVSLVPASYVLTDDWVITTKPDSK